MNWSDRFSGNKPQKPTTVQAIDDRISLYVNGMALSSGRIGRPDYYYQALVEARHALLTELHSRNPWYTIENLPEEWTLPLVFSALQASAQADAWSVGNGDYAKDIYEEMLSKLPRKVVQMTDAILHDPNNFNAQHWYRAGLAQAPQLRETPDSKMLEQKQPPTAHEIELKVAIALDSFGRTKLHPVAKETLFNIAEADTRTQLYQSLVTTHPELREKDIPRAVIQFVLRAAVRDFVLEQLQKPFKLQPLGSIEEDYEQVCTRFLQTSVNQAVTAIGNDLEHFDSEQWYAATMPELPPTTPQPRGKPRKDPEFPVAFVTNGR